MDEKKVSFNEYMSGRAALYSFTATMFSECLTYGKIEILNSIIGKFADIVTEESAKRELDDSAKLMKQWLKKMEAVKNDDEFNLDLAREHAAYFALGKFNIPDTASSTLSKKHLIKRDEWENCKKFYIENGYALKKGSGKLEDSFEIQCRFMEILIRRTVAADDDAVIADLLEKQIMFLKDHMLNWIKIFGENLKNKTTEESMYRAMSMIPFILIKTDTENICEVTDGLGAEYSAE
jgi:TorA maturation chaperone TorD